MAGPAAISTGTLGTYLPPIVCMYVLKRAPAWFRVGKKKTTILFLPPGR